jgi:hypothetical protein
MPTVPPRCTVGGVSLLGHAWRWAFLLGTGGIVSAALAFISG